MFLSGLLEENFVGSQEFGFRQKSRFSEPLCAGVLTVQIARILETLRQTGTTVAVDDLARVSPLLHRHVIPNGTYHFPRAIEGVNLS